MQTLRIAHISDVGVVAEKRHECVRALDFAAKQIKQNTPNVIIVTGGMLLAGILPSMDECSIIDAFLSRMATLGKVIMIDTPDIIRCNGEHQAIKGIFCYNSNTTITDEFANWTIVVDNIFDTIPPMNDYNPTKPNICIFKGEISNDSHIKKEYFDQFHLVLCGGKAEYTILKGHRGNRTIGYTGSLVQQHLGQPINDHCFIMWDVTQQVTQPTAQQTSPKEYSVTHEAVKIPANSGCAYIKIDNGIAKVAGLPKALDYYSIVTNGSDQKTLEEIEKIAEHFKKRPTSIINPDGKNYDHTFNAIRSVDKQCDIIRDALMGVDMADDVVQEHIKRMAHVRSIDLLFDEGDEFGAPHGTSYDPTENDDDRWLGIHISMTKRALNDETFWNTFWSNVKDENKAKIAPIVGKQRITFETLYFENLYCYGEKNKINFSKFNGQIIGLLAPNHMGKSAFIDIIIYALYGKFPRVKKKELIYNNRGGPPLTILHFNINNIPCIIKRGRGIEFIYNGVNLTQSSALDTYKIIAKYVGSFNNALNTSIITQYNYCPSFTDLGQIKRRNIVAELVGVNLIDYISLAIKNECIGLTKKRAKLLALREEYYGPARDAANKQESITLLSAKIADHESKFWSGFQHLLKITSNAGSLAEKLVKYKQEIETIRETAKKYNETVKEMAVITKGMDAIEHAKAYPAQYVEGGNSGRLLTFLATFPGNNKEGEFQARIRLEEDKAFIRTCGTPGELKISLDKAMASYSSTESELKSITTIDKDSLLMQMQLMASAKDKIVAERARIDRAPTVLGTSPTSDGNINPQDIENELELVCNRMIMLDYYQSLLKPSGVLYSHIISPIIVEMERHINGVLRAIQSDITIIISNECEFTFTHGAHDTRGTHGQSPSTSLMPAMLSPMPLSLSSGYQKFAIDFAIRMTLFSMAEVPIPDCFIIDEAFNACDVNHLTAIVRYIESITCYPSISHPSATIIITHLDKLKSKMSKVMHIYSNPSTGQSIMKNAFDEDAKMSSQVSKISSSSEMYTCDFCVKLIRRTGKATHERTKAHLANVALLKTYIPIPI